jgi:ribosomal protein S18 acetylase RimI-like enzyme
MRSVQRAGAPAPTVVRSGGWSARVSPWHGVARTAHVVPFAGVPAPEGDGLATVLDELAALGFDEVVTTALAPPDQTPYLLAGFEALERLHLLSCRLDELPDIRGRAVLRRPRRSEWSAMVGVDERAFDPFWHLDAEGIADAVAATPSARLRIAAANGVVGYAVTGRSGRRGYVQRLAVEPTLAGRGIGSDLLVDGLRWLRSRGAASAMVNTQVGNDRAVALYLRHGFVPVGYDLAVLHGSLAAR